MTDVGDKRTAPPDDPREQTDTTGLFAAWDRRARLWALVWAALTLVVSADF